MHISVIDSSIVDMSWFQSSSCIAPPHGTFFSLQVPAPSVTPASSNLDPGLGQRMDDHRDVMSYEGVEAMVYFEIQMGQPSFNCGPQH